MEHRELEKKRIKATIYPEKCSLGYMLQPDKNKRIVHVCLYFRVYSVIDQHLTSCALVVLSILCVLGENAEVNHMKCVW